MRALRLALAAVAVFATVSAAAQDAAGINTTNGVGIEGYDPVAYFELDAAVPGDPAISVTHDGVTYHFSTAEHRELFLDDPQMYVPAFGGWCAWAVSRGSLVDIDPEQYVVHEGRLYLNYSGFVNTRFRLRLEQNIEAAMRNWPALADEAADR